MHELEVKIPGHSYPVLLGRGIGADLGGQIGKIYRGQNIAVITDENVNRLYGGSIKDSLEGSGFSVYMIVVPPGEKSKSLPVLGEIYDLLLDAGIERSDLIIAFGGGVVGDLGGFAAATFMRGIPLVQVPTTLLAQIDSSIGGKVAVDLPRGKNLVGAFYQPKAVYIDYDFLNSLERRFLRDGMAEVVKYAAIRDRELFDYLLSCPGEGEIDFEKVIPACCRIKKNIVEKDEKDRGDRMLLNFGHTLGHAVEKYYNYEKYTHGEAVAVGMYVFTKNSEAMGLTINGAAEQLGTLLEKFRLPLELPELDWERIIDSIRSDKKNLDGYINVILLETIGKAYIRKIGKENSEEIIKLIKS